MKHRNVSEGGKITVQAGGGASLKARQKHNSRAKEVSRNEI